MITTIVILFLFLWVSFSGLSLVKAHGCPRKAWLWLRFLAMQGEFFPAAVAGCFVMEGMLGLCKFKQYRLDLYVNNAPR